MIEFYEVLSNSLYDTLANLPSFVENSIFFLFFIVLAIASIMLFGILTVFIENIHVKFRDIPMKNILYTIAIITVIFISGTVVKTSIQLSDDERARIKENDIEFLKEYVDNTIFENKHIEQEYIGEKQMNEKTAHEIVIKDNNELYRVIIQEEEILGEHPYGVEKISGKESLE